MRGCKTLGSSRRAGAHWSSFTGCSDIPPTWTLTPSGIRMGHGVSIRFKLSRISNSIHSRAHEQEILNTPTLPRIVSLGSLSSGTHRDTDQTAPASPRRAALTTPLPSRSASITEFPSPPPIDTMCLLPPRPDSLDNSVRRQASRSPPKAPICVGFHGVAPRPIRPVDTGSDHSLRTCQNSIYAQAQAICA